MLVCKTFGFPIVSFALAAAVWLANFRAIVTVSRAGWLTSDKREFHAKITDTASVATPLTGFRPQGQRNLLLFSIVPPPRLTQIPTSPCGSERASFFPFWLQHVSVSAFFFNFIVFTRIARDFGTLRKYVFLSLSRRSFYKYFAEYASTLRNRLALSFDKINARHSCSSLLFTNEISSKISSNMYHGF